MIISFTNVIGAIRSLGEAAQVITTNLKMWLGFETSETLGRELAPSSLSIENGSGGGTITQISENSYSSSSDGNNSSTIRPKFDFNTESGKTYKLVITPTGTISGTVHFDFNDGVSYLFQDYDFTTTKEIYFTDNGQVFGAFNGQQVYNITGFTISLKELTQITPDKSGNNNVGELFTGKALEFDGSNDKVDIDFTTQIKSAVFWVKPLDTGVQSILGFGGAYSGSKYIKSVNNNIQSAGLSSVSVFVNGVSTTSVPVNQWSRVVVNFALLTPQELTFGYGFDTYGYIELSDVQLYNENLSADDIAYDYANPNKLAIDNPSTSLSVTNLKGYWALSEGDGKLAYDSGTNLEEEEVVDGDFSSETNWVLSSASISDNKCTMTSVGGALTYFYQSGLNLTQDKPYNISFKATRISGDTNLTFNRASGNNVSGAPTISNTNEYSFNFTPSQDENGFGLKRFANGSGAVWEIENFSVREVTASDHGGLLFGADYVDAQPRIPQLGMMNWSKGSNLFPYSEDFTEWIISPTTSQVVLAPTEAAPYGQGDVYSIIMQASESDAYIRYATTNATLTSSTHSVWVKQAPTGSATHIRITNNDRTAWNTGTSQKIALTSSWQRLETTDAITGNRFTIIGSADASGIQDSDCIGKALIYGAQLVEGSSAGAYRFTDGAATSNSTVIANPTIPTQDIFGNAVRDRLNSFNLDGTGYAEVADDTDLDFGTGDFTIECWVKADFEFKGSSINVILSLGGSGSGSGSAALVAHSTNKLGGYVNGSTLDADSVFTIGDWYHVAITRNGSGLCTLYVDSVAQTDTETNQGNITNSDTKLIGRDTGTSRFYKNLISDVRLYDAELSATEIENNYNAGLSAHTND